jgi:uncharacterized membrane protein YccF (DUF307 family)
MMPTVASLYVYGMVVFAHENFYIQKDIKPFMHGVTIAKLLWFHHIFYWLFLSHHMTKSYSSSTKRTDHTTRVAAGFIPL